MGRARRAASPATCRARTNPAVYAAGDSADTAGHAADPGRGLRGQGRRLQHAQGHHHRPRTTPASRPRSSPSPSSPASACSRPKPARPGIDVDVRYSDTSGWYSNYRIGETTAAAKILIDRSSDRIVGAHLLGPEYGELINILGLAIKLGLTTRQLKSMTAAYPTVGSDLGSML